MRHIVMPLLLLSLVGACSQISSLTNSLRAQEGPPSLIPEENMMSGIKERKYMGKPVYQIADLKLEPTSDAELDARQSIGTPTNRQLTAGKFLSTGTLEGIRKIVIIGETNSLSIRP
ncbi:MAG: hypothetical protein EBX04_08830 [Rhodobacteraceae bacterium]|nr:hypothetical protein [Paracoccaceae bacterium]